MCVSYTRITGNVKSKHKQYDHWHSQDFSTGGQSEGAKRPSGGRVCPPPPPPPTVRRFVKICVSKRNFVARLFGVGYVVAYRPINSLLPPPPFKFVTLWSTEGWEAWVLVPLILVMPVYSDSGVARICQRGAKTREQSDRAWGGCVCVCVCGGGGVEIMCIQCLFGHIKRLIRPPFYHFCLVSAINGGLGPSTPPPLK